MIEGRPLAWRFSAADRGDTWSWTKLEPEAKFKEVLEKLSEFETKSWGEISQTGSHEVSIGRLAKVAKARLTAIEQDDVDALMSFRITGVNRVWCVRLANIMRVLWWDPDHEVCPSPKRHT